MNRVVASKGGRTYWATPQYNWNLALETPPSERSPVPCKHPAIEAAFSKLEEEKKWKLSTGKIVDDVLYEFGKQCLVGHRACSMILDLRDKNHLKECTEAEIEEMKIKNPIQFISPIPKELATYINAFNLTNFKDLRA
ncbi:hypothetical protein BD408DRAFT_429479 [Parasitella parasitica]|nr:hypothetical protein BD408DRAFT_429479 [Parasitella parasitica]